MIIHVVRSGETPNSIAALYGADPQRVLADNEVPANGALAVGQTLVIRLPLQTHTLLATQSPTVQGGSKMSFSLINDFFLQENVILYC